MADIAKRAGKEDARSHRGRGADIGKRAGSRADDNGRRHRRHHKSAAPSPLEVATATPVSPAAPSSPIAATSKPASTAATSKPASITKPPSIAKPPSIVKQPPAVTPTPTSDPAPAPAPTPAEKPAPVVKVTTAEPPTAPKSTVVKADPATLDFVHLFNNPAMFESRDTWQAAGFTIIAGKSAGEILVAIHPSVPGILFKKFTSAKSDDDQLRNYQTRIEGARKLRAFIAANRLEGIAVPRKWIQRLPGPDVEHILVEDYLNVLSRRDTQEAYNNIDDKTLRDLCVVVRAFPGLDSGARNMLITKDSKIAFIDTERWDEKRDRDRDRPGLRHIRDYLSDKQRKTVQKIFQQLDEA